MILGSKPFVAEKEFGLDYKGCLEDIGVVAFCLNATRHPTVVGRAVDTSIVLLAGMGTISTILFPRVVGRGSVDEVEPLTGRGHTFTE